MWVRYCTITQLLYKSCKQIQQGPLGQINIFTTKPVSPQDFPYAIPIYKITAIKPIEGIEWDMYK